VRHNLLLILLPTILQRHRSSLLLQIRSIRSRCQVLYISANHTPFHLWSTISVSFACFWLSSSRVLARIS
jgi:hypothetical protein